MFIGVLGLFVVVFYCFMERNAFYECSVYMGTIWLNNIICYSAKQIFIIIFSLFFMKYLTVFDINTVEKSNTGTFKYAYVIKKINK